jgi:hypothetical protein
MPHRTKS